MDGIDFLLLKWDDMDNKRKIIWLIAILGVVAFGLDQILNFIVKWISPYYSQNPLPSSLNWIMHAISFIPINDLIIITIYALITIFFMNRVRVTTEEKWFNLCARLYGQVRKDHTNVRNLVWDSNNRQHKLLFRDELDQLIYDAENMFEDKKKNG